MALSKPKSVEFSVALTERYFKMVFQKYGVAFPGRDASSKEMSNVPSLNDHTPCHTRVAITRSAEHVV